MLLNVGVENAEAAVDVGETAPKLLLIDRQVWQTHARNALVEIKEPFAKRQMRLHRRVEFESLCIPRVDI